jgi:hypothetical protein
MASREDVRGRWLWKAMPWAMFTVCSTCGRFVYCHGKARDRLLCLDCYPQGQVAADRRGGKRGQRSGYQYLRRRAKWDTIERVGELKTRGWVVGRIAAELGLADSTVRKYLAQSEASEK